MNAGRVETLPKWAQQHIKMLERNLADANGELDRIGRGESSLATILSSSDLNARIPLVDDHIRFFPRLGADWIELGTFDVRPNYVQRMGAMPKPNRELEADGLRVSCVNGRLDIEPLASNLIVVRNTR